MITFAIITAGDVDYRVETIIDSIEANFIPFYEVLVVGGSSSTIDRHRTRHIPFDENVRAGWITRKKNIANSEARFDTIVFLHDYHVFDADWFEKFQAYEDDWDIQCHRVLTTLGHRVYDWVTWDHPTIPSHINIPYERSDLTQYQYISGGYWVSKRHVIEQEPLNESLGHHQAEDVEWSLRVRRKFKIVMNAACVVRHNKLHRETHLCEEREVRSKAYFR